MDHLPTPELEQQPRPGLLVRWAIPISLGTAAAALFLFVWIADEVFREHAARFDLAFRDRVHHFSSPALTRLAFAASFMGASGMIVVLLISLAIFLYLRWRKAAAWLVITMLGALVLDLSLKYAFHRARPSPFFGPLPSTYSFPSGHALFSFCAYGVLAGLTMGRIKPLVWRIVISCASALLIAAIGLSRIYLGVHYPTDVLAGYLAAAMWVSSMVGLDRLRVRSR